MRRLEAGAESFEGKDYSRDLLMASVIGKDMGPTDVVLLKMASDLMASAGQGVSSEWMEVGTVSEQGLTEGQRLEMYKRSRKLVRVEPMASNLQRLLMAHVAGRGFFVGLQPGADGNDHTLQKRFEAYFGGTEARRLEFFRTIISHTLKNGTIYAVNQPFKGTSYGRPNCRLILPDYKTGEKVGDGWAINSQVKGYKFAPLEKQAEKVEGLKDGWIPSEAVTEFHVLKDFNDGKYGLSFYFWLLKTIPRYKDFLDLRENAMRAEQFVFIVRYLKGLEGGAFRETPLRSGVMDANEESEKYEMLQTTSKARDATADGDEIRARMTQATPFTEPTLTGNPRYAAQVGALGFPGPIMEMFQDDFTSPIQEVVSKTLGCDEKDVLVGWPFTDRGDRAKIVAELNGMRATKDISRKAMHRRLGYNAELIVSELQEERAQELADAAAPLTAETVAPAASPLGRTLPGLTQAPLSAPVAAPTPQIQFSMPTASMTIPYEKVSEGTIAGDMFGGIDAGYKHGGIVIAGTDGKNIMVIGNVEVKDLPVEGDPSWRTTIEKIMVMVPRLKTIYVSSDDPQLVDMLNELELEIVPMQISDEEAEAEIVESRIKIEVSEQAAALLSALNPEERDAKAGMHLTEEDHVLEAFKYLTIGHLRGR